MLLFAYPSVLILPTPHRFISLALKGLGIWADFISQAEVGSTQHIASTKWSLEGLNHLSLLRSVRKSSQMRMEELSALGCLRVLTTWLLAFSRAWDPREKARRLQCHL